MLRKISQKIALFASILIFLAALVFFVKHPSLGAIRDKLGLVLKTNFFSQSLGKGGNFISDLPKNLKLKQSFRDLGLIKTTPDEFFKAQEAQRKKGDKEAHQYDKDYIEALEYGMPPAAGIGIGIDRLVVLLTDSKTLREAILFPTMKPKRK